MQGTLLYRKFALLDTKPSLFELTLSNIQLTKINSKTRNGGFGLKD